MRDNNDIIDYMNMIYMINRNLVLIMNGKFIFVSNAYFARTENRMREYACE